MEIKISIVEDSKEQGKLLENCLLEWADHYGISAGIFRYEEAEEFLDTEYQENFLIFLDIDLKTTTGLVVAGKIRKAGYQGHIIFLTAFREYVFEGYHVRALDYLLKPVSYEMLDNALKPVLESLSKSYFVFQNKQELVKLPYTEILVILSFGHYVEIKTKGEAYRYRESINTLERILPDGFVRIHRTVIVNISYVTKIRSHELYLNTGEILPISSKYLKKVQSAFLRQMP